MNKKFLLFLLLTIGVFLLLSLSFVSASKTISLTGTACTDNHLSFSINNTGDETIAQNELQVTINDIYRTSYFIDKGIAPGNVSSYSDLTTVYSGKLNVKVEAPDNTIGWGITCPSHPSTISDCAELNQTNTTYYLQANIIDSSATICMRITADNVTLHCQDYKIDGINAVGSIGVLKRPDSTIVNCSITDWEYDVVVGINIADCSVLNQNNAIYYLTQDIIDSSNSTCMDMTGTNITLDCQGHRIDGIDASGSTGIKMRNNNIVRNCEVSGWFAGIDVGDNCLVEDSETHHNTVDSGLGLGWIGNNNLIRNHYSHDEYRSVINGAHNLVEYYNCSNVGYGCFHVFASNNTFRHSYFGSGISLSWLPGGNNTVYNNTFDAESMGSALDVRTDYNQIYNNTFHNQLFLLNASYNTLTDLVFSNCPQQEAWLDNSNNNIITDVIITNGDRGMLISNSDDIEIINFEMKDSYRHAGDRRGVTIEGGNNIFINNFKAYNLYNDGGECEGIGIHDSSNITVNNLTAWNISSPGEWEGQPHDFGRGFHVWNSDNITITNSLVYDIGEQGYRFDSSRGCYAENIEAYNCSVGIFLPNVEDMEIVKSYFHNNYNDGINIRDNSKNILIEGNTIVGSDTCINSEANNTKIFNNLVQDCGYAGIMVGPRWEIEKYLYKNIEIRNNIITGLPLLAIRPTAIENLIIHNNTGTSSANAIQLINCKNVSINENDMVGRWSGGLLWLVENTTIEGNYFHDSPEGSGLVLYDSVENKILRNEMKHNFDNGLVLFGSNSSEVRWNILNNSGDGKNEIIVILNDTNITVPLSGGSDIYLENSANDVIEGNELYTNETGIHLVNSNNIDIINHTSYAYTGIHLENSNNIDIINHTISNAFRGIEIRDSEDILVNDFSINGGNISDSEQQSFSIESGDRVTIENGLIEQQGRGSVERGEDITWDNVTFQNIGFHCVHHWGNRFTFKNSVANNIGLTGGWGVVVAFEGDGHYVGYNKIYNSTGNAIQFNSGSGHTIEHNEVYNSFLGILFMSTENSNIRNNYFENSATGPLLYLTNSSTLESNEVYNSTYGGLYVEVGEGNTVKNNVLKYNRDGIFLYLADDNKLEGNIMEHNRRYGLIVYNSSVNGISYNRMQFNSGGGTYTTDEPEGFELPLPTGNNTDLYLENSDFNKGCANWYDTREYVNSKGNIISLNPCSVVPILLIVVLLGTISLVVTTGKFVFEEWTIDKIVAMVLTIIIGIVLLVALLGVV